MALVVTGISTLITKTDANATAIAALATAVTTLATATTTIGTASTTAAAHLTTSDLQMSELTEAMGAVGLAAGANNVGAVNLAVNNALVGVGSTRVPVATAVSATPISRSSIVNTANTPKTIAAAKTDRVFLSVQNQDTAVDLWLNELGTASATDGSSLRIPPGGLYEPPAGCVPIGAISILSTKANHQIYAREL
jgi:hypothetical protein